jgi:hypothetical protein|tara:strand:+ start:238 stop:627 length:390 start_codon:yes stop_codon:yes gene_type:complete
VAKKAFVSLTGGLNNVDRPDTLEEDQLQECVNYEITGVGKLEKRTDPSDIVESNINELLDIVFESVIFVSEPYYPPNKIDGNFGDYMLFIYGIEKKQDPNNDPDVFRMEIAMVSEIEAFETITAPAATF